MSPWVGIWPSLTTANSCSPSSSIPFFRSRDLHWVKRGQDPQPWPLAIGCTTKKVFPIDFHCNCTSHNLPCFSVTTWKENKSINVYAQWTMHVGIQGVSAFLSMSRIRGLSALRALATKIFSSSIHRQLWVKSRPNDVSKKRGSVFQCSASDPPSGLARHRSNSNLKWTRRSPGFNVLITHSLKKSGSNSYEQYTKLPSA